jgi:hypothetical protein
MLRAMAVHVVAQVQGRVSAAPVANDTIVELRA